MRAAWVLLLAAATAAADDLEDRTTWEEVRSQGESIVFGRLEGRFDGPQYRSRKIRVRNRQTKEEHLIAIEPGRGYFETSLPVGAYEVIAIEARYFPPVKPMNPSANPSFDQRYALRPVRQGRNGEIVGLPSFPVVTEMPLYLGTILSHVNVSGIVYEGHEIRIVDEYQEAWDRLGTRHPVLAESFRRRDIVPMHFFVEPALVDPRLELASGEGLLERARAEIDGGKYAQAVSWLETALPASDAESAEIRLLKGEALLADKKYAEAIEELGESLLTRPENTRALRLLARAHALHGDAEDALDLYRAVEQAVPDDAEASLHIGYHYALHSQAEAAGKAFDDAFRVNFDYLLHDLTPYALALKAKGANYQPPEVRYGVGRVPGNMRSRRGSKGAFAVLLDHNGRVVAVHLRPESDSWVPATVMAILGGRFRAARLNGVAIPCLIVLGAEDPENADP